MSVIRLLNNGNWNKPPVLTAARKIFMDVLSSRVPSATLGDMASFVNGTSYDTGFLSSDGTPIIRISNITTPKSEYLRTVEQFDEKYIVRPGDLLVSWSASFKSIVWPGPKGVLNQHIFKVTAEGGNHKSYIRHAIEAAFDAMQQKVVGIGMMHLRRDDFLGHRVPRPDSETQKAVSDFLDWLESSGEHEPPLPPLLCEARQVVARIEELNAKIQEARGLRQQAADEAKVLADAASRVLFGPPDHEVGEIADVTKLAGFEYTKYLAGAPAGDVILLRAGNVRNSGLDLSNAATLPTEISNQLPRSQLRAGDVVMTFIGAKIGDVTFVSPDHPRLHCGPNVAKLTPHSLIDQRFLAGVLQSPIVQDQIREITKVTAQPNLSMKTIRKLRLPVPSLPEQGRIVAYLDSLREKTDGLKALQAETAEELDALMPSILDKAFRGEL